LAEIFVVPNALRLDARASDQYRPKNQFFTGDQFVAFAQTVGHPKIQSDVT
jgi:hypothetical protein